MRKTMIQMQGGFKLKGRKLSETKLTQEFKNKFENFLIEFCENFNINGNFQILAEDSTEEVYRDEVYAQ